MQEFQKIPSFVRRPASISCRGFAVDKLPDGLNSEPIGDCRRKLLIDLFHYLRNRELVASLWSHWTGTGAPDLPSFAAITDGAPHRRFLQLATIAALCRSGSTTPNSISVGSPLARSIRAGRSICFRSDGDKSNCQQSLPCSAWNRTAGGGRRRCSESSRQADR